MTQYASGKELWTRIQGGDHTHDSLLLQWRCDKYEPEGKITARSREEDVLHEIRFEKDSSRWLLRSSKDADGVSAAYASLGEAMQAADAKEQPLKDVEA